MKLHIKDVNTLVEAINKDKILLSLVQKDQKSEKNGKGTGLRRPQWSRDGGEMMAR